MVMMSWTTWSMLIPQRCIMSFDSVKNNNYFIDQVTILDIFNFSSQGVDVISTTLRREFTYDQRQGTCPEVRGQLPRKYACLKWLQLHFYPVLLFFFLCSTSVLTMPIVRQTLTVFQAYQTLIVMVMLWLLTISVTILVASYLPHHPL